MVKVLRRAIAALATGLLLASGSCATVRPPVLDLSRLDASPDPVWTIAESADDDAPFCVTFRKEPTGDPADSGLHCTTVGAVRRFVRTIRLAENR